MIQKTWYSSASATTLPGALQCMHMHIPAYLGMYLLCNKALEGSTLYLSIYLSILLHIDRKQLS